ncbi:MAG: glycosyl hydrolase family 28-related protein, partial [Opitutales bacterium]|nr:glycosyl hydrolase family 28-related protein [Opitutales bacterium]
MSSRSLFLRCLSSLLCWNAIALSVHGANQPPVLQPIGNKTVEAGSPLSFTVQGSNSDADLLSFGTGKDVPIIFWASQPVKPDQTILATCGGTNSSSTAQLSRLADGDPGSPLAAKPLPTSWTNITPHTASNRSVFATVPANWARGIYAMRLKTGAVTGPVRLVNAPDPWFVQGDMGDTATTGGFFIVAGNCLEIPNYKGPRIALVRNGAVVKTIASPVRMTTSEGYALRFTVPSDTPEGDYTLYVHNGCGGPSGWVRFSNFSHVPIETVTVRAFQPWPATVFPVAAPSGTGNDAKITAALDLAKANGGGVVLIPEGTYLLTQPVLIPARVILRGAGRAKTFLKWVNNPSVSNPELPGLVMNLNYTKDEPFGLEDLSLEIANNDYWGPVVYRGFTRVPSVFQRLDIIAPLLDTVIEKNMPFGIHLRRTSNLRIHDVSVVSSKGIFGRDDVTHIRVTDSTVTWNNFAFKFSAKNHNLIIHNNVVLVSGPTRTHTSLCLTPFHDPKGPYNRDFLWANNRIAAAEDFEDHSGGYTADGSDGIYLGKVSGCDGNTMTLAGSTSTVDVGGKPADYT